jgi:hypothetical protein
MWAPTTDASAAGTTETGTSDIMQKYFAFDGGATEENVDFCLVMPENWDLGTIKAKFYWGSAAGSTAADTVQWGIKAVAVSDDDAGDATWGTAQVITDTLLADDGADLQVTATTPAITIGGTPAKGDLIHFKVYRDTDGTDDMAEDAHLFGVVIQYAISVEIKTVWS